MNGSDEHMDGYLFVPQENIPWFANVRGVVYYRESPREMLK